MDSLDNTIYPPLINAARSGHVEVVRVLLEGGADVERVNAIQDTALHAAAYFGYLEVCRLLLDWGAKVDRMDKWSDTPLHVAARWDLFAAVQLLVERGADVRLKINNGQAASDLAHSEVKKDVAEWLGLVSRG